MSDPRPAPHIGDTELDAATPQPAKLGETPFHPDPPAGGAPKSWPEEFGVPEYRSHKVVRAAQVMEIIQGLGIRLGGIQQIWIPGADYMQKHNPAVGGYVVFYGDGYTSYSPQAAFEDGYTRLSKWVHEADAGGSLRGALREDDLGRTRDPRFAQGSGGVSLPPADALKPDANDVREFVTDHVARVATPGDITKESPATDELGRHETKVTAPHNADDKIVDASDDDVKRRGKTVADKKPHK